MKIMVCGKGGTGKTALTVLMAKVLTGKYRVYIVDSDESNILLPKLLGVNPPTPLIEYIGGKMDEEELERREIDITKILAKTGSGVRLSSLPNEYISYSKENIGLITIGKVREYGEGCACPFNILTRIVLKNLVLEDDEVVLVDTDAGIEHVGRRVEETVDCLVIIVDPTAESLHSAVLLRDIASNLGKRYWIIANKVTPRVWAIIKREAEKLKVKIDGAVRFDDDLYESVLLGEAIKSTIALEDVEKILKNIMLI
ncbi:ATP-binding protein [Candidatus Bathyarchaeota archaeon]|nr:ATP-binding protein [Candidatus Bathyarchaeota archaeon]MBS7617949.1 ATP-binding protein [Candidatus Bathyarchaeota archaeon]